MVLHHLFLELHRVWATVCCNSHCEIHFNSDFHCDLLSTIDLSPFFFKDFSLASCVLVPNKNIVISKWMQLVEELSHLFCRHEPPSADDRLHMTWNVTIAFISWHKILAVQKCLQKSKYIIYSRSINHSKKQRLVSWVFFFLSIYFNVTRVHKEVQPLCRGWQGGGGAAWWSCVTRVNVDLHPGLAPAPQGISLVSPQHGWVLQEFLRLHLYSVGIQKT